MNHKYTVVISQLEKNNKKRLHGLLKYYEDNKLGCFDFSPDSILCDLSIFNYDKETNIKYNKGIYIDEVVYTGYEYEKALDNIRINKHNDTYYYSLAQLIKKQILNRETFTIKNIEKLRLYFDIKMNYSISYKETSKTYRKKETREFVPLQYGFCSIEKFLDKKNKRKENEHIYDCNNLTEVLFSILHYLIYNGFYYIGECNHCNNLYFFNHQKIKYCTRKSPFDNYNHLECEQAVRNIKQKFTRKYDSIIQTLDTYYYEDKNLFTNDYYKLKIMADKKSSVSNLKAIDEFLNDYRKYKKHKILSVAESLKQYKNN